MDYVLREYYFIQIEEASLAFPLYLVILSLVTQGAVNPNYPSYRALSLSPAFCLPIHSLDKAQPIEGVAWGPQRHLTTMALSPQFNSSTD